MELIRWCALCNERRADGTLTVEDPLIEELVPLPACQKCVDGLDMPEQLTLEF